MNNNQQIETRNKYEIDIKDFKFSEMPDSGKWEVFSYGNIKIYEYDVKVELVLRKLDTNNPIFFVANLNLDLICFFPLLRIIENKQLSSDFSHNTKKSFQFDLSKAKRIQAKDVWALQKYIDSIPNKVEGYERILHKNMSIGDFSENNLTYQEILERYLINAKEAFRKQWILKLECLNTKKTIFIPEYEIFRHFYITSSSMARAIMRSSPKSLCKEIIVKNSEDGLHKNATIILNNNAKNNDAENIYRFLKDEYAAKQWQETQVRLAANKIKDKVTYIGASIPYNGIVDMTLYVKDTGQNSYAGFFIVEENTPYDFNELIVLRLLPPPRKENLSDEGKLKTVNKNIPTNPYSIEEIVNDTPSSENSDIYIGQDGEMYEAVYSLKKGLDGKKVSHNTVDLDKLPGDFVKTTQKRVNINAVSVNSTKKSGNEQVAPAQVNPVKNVNLQSNEDEDEELTKMLIDRKSVTLEHFKEMIEKLQIELQLKCQDVTIVVDDRIVPLKTKKKETVEKADQIPYLNDGSRRKYVSVFLEFNGLRHCLLEIERDKIVMPSRSTLIFKNADGINSNTFKKVLQKFVDGGGKWPDWIELGLSKPIYMKHPVASDDAKVIEWVKRIARLRPLNISCQHKML